MILKSFSDSLTSSCCQSKRPQRHRHAKIHALPKTLSYDGRFPKEDAHCGCLNLEKDRGRPNPQIRVFEEKTHG